MIETGRLVLRQWRGEDVAPFAEMNRDVEVMEHMMQKNRDGAAWVVPASGIARWPSAEASCGLSAWFMKTVAEASGG